MKEKLIAALALAAFVGCASIERTSPGMMDGLDVVGGNTPAEQTVCIRANGYGLLYLFTAICGNVEYDKVNHSVTGGFLLFYDGANCADCYRSLQCLANDEGKKLTNVNMFNNSLPSQGITGYADLVGWFIEAEDVGCSGVLRAK